MRPHTSIYKDVLASNELLAKTEEEMPQAQSFLQEMTDLVFAPTVALFSGWMLREAVFRKIPRLYFLARDGWQFYRAARILQEAWQLPVEVRYLCCSRYSLRLPGFWLMGEEALDFICLRGMEVTFADMMLRAGIDRKEAERIAELIGYEREITEPIPLTKIEGFRGQLAACPGFMEQMEKNSREAYDNALGYFTQEGLLASEPYAIVDSGWTGTTQQVLERLLASAGRKQPMEGFYFGLYDLPRGAEPSRYHTFYFSWEGQIKRKELFSNSLFEAVFSAPHGMTVGYEKKDGVYAPVYGSSRGLQNEEMEEQTSRMESFARRFARLVKEDEASGNRWDQRFEDKKSMTSFLDQLLRVFMSRPDEQEAQYFGNYLFSDDVTEERVHPLALPMTEDELRSGHILEKFRRLYLGGELPVKESAWYEGSAALYSEKAAWHQRHYRRYKELIYLRKGLERKLRK